MAQLAVAAAGAAVGSLFGARLLTRLTVFELQLDQLKKLKGEEAGML
jgi:hypothetical protein